MDGREPDRSTVPGGRQLTRRELRAAQAAGLEVPAESGKVPASVPTEAGAPEAGAPEAGAPETAWPLGELGRPEAESWEAAVGWALRGELPARLPPEPAELDDVRWGPLHMPHQPDGPEGPGHSGVGGPAGLPADSAPGDDEGDLDELARRLEPARLPDVPADDHRPWSDSGLWDERAEAPASDVTVGAAGGGQGPRRVSVLGGATNGSPAFGIGLPAPGGIGWAGREPVPPGYAPEPFVAPEEPMDELTEEVFGPAMAAPVVEPPALPTPVAEPPSLPTPVAEPPSLPTLNDLLATRPAPADGPAEWGWRGALRRVSGGLIAPGPGDAELAERASVAAVQRPIDGPRTIVVVNPKGGAHKTTATLLIAATFGRLRGGYTLAWDNNETRGTLGWRSRHATHTRTAVDLLEDLERFADPSSSRVGDLDAYVRSQAAAQFDVLASDENAASAASVDAFAFRALHRTLLRFYRVLVVDTGNNMRSSNWQAALEAADQVVVVSTMREDTAQSAAWMLDALRATGHGDAVSRAVTVLSQPAPRIDAELTARLHDHFGRLTRTVLEVPYEPALVSGGPIDIDAMSTATRRAWLHVAAAVADGL